VAPTVFAWLSHPNYWIVAIEGIALPMVHSAWMTAIAFTVLNAILLLGLSDPHGEPCVGRAPVSTLDLVIVGAGPAGLATAIFARQAGLSVCVLDGGPTDGDKACGEGLMPGVAPLLAELGIDPPGEELVGVGLPARVHSG